MQKPGYVSVLKTYNHYPHRLLCLREPHRAPRPEHQGQQFHNTSNRTKEHIQIICCTCQE